jgi:hypothetical protein
LVFFLGLDPEYACVAAGAGGVAEAEFAEEFA